MTTTNNPPLPERDALAQVLREALSWGMVYGPELSRTQWDEMREHQVTTFTDRLATLADDRAARQGVRPAVYKPGTTLYQMVVDGVSRDFENAQIIQEAQLSGHAVDAELIGAVRRDFYARMAEFYAAAEQVAPNPGLKRVEWDSLSPAAQRMLTQAADKLNVARPSEQLRNAVLSAAQPEPIAAEPVPYTRIPSQRVAHLAKHYLGEAANHSELPAFVQAIEYEAQRLATPAPEVPADRAALAEARKLAIVLRGMTQCPVSPDDLWTEDQPDGDPFVARAAEMLESFAAAPAPEVPADRAALAAKLIDALTRFPQSSLHYHGKLIRALAAAPEAPGTQDGDRYRFIRDNACPVGGMLEVLTIDTPPIHLYGERMDGAIDALMTAPRLRPVAPEAPAQPVQGEPVAFDLQRVWDIVETIAAETVRQTDPTNSFNAKLNATRRRNRLTAELRIMLDELLFAPPARKWVTKAEVMEIVKKAPALDTAEAEWLYVARALLAHVGVELEGGV